MNLEMEESIEFSFLFKWGYGSSLETLEREKRAKKKKRKEKPGKNKLIYYSKFLNSVIHFLIILLKKILFLLYKMVYEKMKKRYGEKKIKRVGSLVRCS